jgi:N-acetylmuramoyl-L-alanine amidase
MSNVTWFKIFPDGSQCFVVAYAGAEPVVALKTIKKEEVCNFLKDYPNAHTIHVAGVGESIPRVPKVLPENGNGEDPRWISWAKTPKNDQRLAGLTNNYGHPNMQGKYSHGWPEGIIYHHTAGHPDPYGTIEYLWTRYPCLVVDRDGNLYQCFPLDEWGYHSGTPHHRYCVGVEVIGAGLLEPVNIGGVTKYAPWFALDQDTGVLTHPGLCLDQSECRHIGGNNIRTEGWYQKFTPEQEQTVEKLCLYLKKQRPDIFSFDKIKGHDEAVAEDGDPYCKNDPGGSLSITMDEFRHKLKEHYANE